MKKLLTAALLALPVLAYGDPIGGMSPWAVIGSSVTVSDMNVVSEGDGTITSDSTATFNGYFKITNHKWG